ncbi:MAG: amino acid ABC transporter substrate-binding protein [bacterium]|nr:amino acid ABC transporter substrate-binding protein [bacterium]
MKKLIVTGIFCILYTSTLYAKQHLVLAKVEGLSDQYIGEYILTKAYEYLDIKLTFRILPARRAIIWSSQGEVDGEIQRISQIEKSYPTLIKVPTPINHIQLCVFFRKKIPFRTLKDFREYRFIYIRGIKGYEPLLKYFKSSRAVTTDDQMWRMIQYKRADFTLVGRINGMYTLKALGIKGIYPLRPPQKTFPIYHYLHEKHRDLAPKIDRILQKMAKNNELTRLKAQAVERLFNSIPKK